MCTQRFKRVYLLLKVTESFSGGWLLSTYVLYILAHDLTIGDAALLNACYMFANMAINVFTGRLGDIIGQKKVYLLGTLVHGVAFLIYGSGSTFLVFLCAELVAATGSALASDALESWLWNLVPEAEANAIYAKGASYQSIAVILPAILGSILYAKYAVQLPMLVAGILSIVAFVFGTLVTRNLHEVFDHKRLGSISSALTIVARNNRMHVVVLVTVLPVTAYQAYNMLWTPILESLAGDATWLGSVWVLIAVFKGIGEYLTGFKLPTKKVFTFVLLSIAVPMMLIQLAPTSLAVVLTLFLLHQSGRASLKVFSKVYAQPAIPNEMRSTVNSILGSVNLCGSVLGLLLLYLVNHFELQPTQIWFYASIFIVLCAFVIQWKAK